MPIVTSLGAREDVDVTVKRRGGIARHDAIDDRFARTAIDKGADGPIAVATRVGGRSGTLSPRAVEPATALIA